MTQSDGTRRRVSAGFGRPDRKEWRFRFDNVLPGDAVFRYGDRRDRLKEIELYVGSGHKGVHPLLKDLPFE